MEMTANLSKKNEQYLAKVRKDKSKESQETYSAGMGNGTVTSLDSFGTAK